jgi:hypothetical protein
MLLLLKAITLGHLIIFLHNFVTIDSIAATYPRTPKRRKYRQHPRVAVVPWQVF